MMEDLQKTENNNLKKRIRSLENDIEKLSKLENKLNISNRSFDAANQQLAAANQQLEANEHQIRQHMEQFKSLLDGIDDVIYVSDPNTYELVHVNDTARKSWGENIIGKKCYKALQNRESPCPFCTNDIIFNKNPGQTYYWEFQNEVNKHWYRCADKAIDWPDGRKLRFELASDITEIKDYQANLKLANQQLSASEQQLKAANQQLDASNQQLAAANQQLEASEKGLKKATHQLQERLKEMDCLFSISESVSNNTEIAPILEDTLNAIPYAWHYPDITAACISYKDIKFKSKNYQETKWKQNARIEVNKKEVGKIEVCYLEKKADIDEGPFMKEERKLLNTIAKTIGRAIEKIQSENELKITYQQLVASEQQLKAANQQLTAANQQLEANEHQIRQHMEQFKSLLDGIDDVIYVSDPDTYELVHVNDTARKFWGEDIIGQKCYKALQNRESPCPFCTNNIIFNKNPGQTYFWEFQNEVNKHWFRCADKAIDWPDGRKLRFELASDISEIKQTQQELRESEEKIRLIADNASEMIYQMSLPDGKYEYVSPASENIFGIPPEDFYNNPALIQNLIHPDWKNYFKKEWEKLLKGDMSPEYEYQIISREGETRFLHQGNTLILDDKGKPSKLLGIVSNISERKDAEQKLENLNKNLEAKTQELQQILYITTHDLRSPLVNIQGFSKELEASVNEIIQILNNEKLAESIKNELMPILDEELPEAIHYITSSITKMDILLKGLLQISRLGRQQVNIVPLEMNELMQDVVDSFKYEIEKNKIDIHIKDLPRCMGDHAQINQLFSNLFGNAIKFLHNDRAGKISLCGQKKGKMIVYSLEDNGIGIHPDHKNKIFELFHKLDPNKPGSGLGMNIVKQIIEKHKGKIEVESQLAKGTKVIITLNAVN